MICCTTLGKTGKLLKLYEKTSNLGPSGWYCSRGVLLDSRKKRGNMRNPSAFKEPTKLKRTPMFCKRFKFAKFHVPFWGPSTTVVAGRIWFPWFLKKNRRPWLVLTGALKGNPLLVCHGLQFCLNSGFPNNKKWTLKKTPPEQPLR